MFTTHTHTQTHTHTHTRTHTHTYAYTPHVALLRVWCAASIFSLPVLCFPRVPRGRGGTLSHPSQYTESTGKYGGGCVICSLRRRALMHCTQHTYPPTHHAPHTHT